MGIAGFMNWEFTTFTPMLVNREGHPGYPWPKSEIIAAYADVTAAARDKAETLRGSGTQGTELATIKKDWVPEEKGFFGFGSKPGYYREEQVPTRPGGWRLLRRPAYHYWVDFQYESPRSAIDEMRCDEAWLRPDGGLAVGMITYLRYRRSQWDKGPESLPNDMFQQILGPAGPDDLLTFDVSFEGGIVGRERGNGVHEEFRPHTGGMRFSQRPFDKILNALQSAPDHGPVPGNPW